MIRFDWLSKWAQYSGSKQAVKEFETDRTMTYAQLNNVVQQVAHTFISHCGLQRGDRVAIFAENSLEHLILFFTAQKTGLIIVPLNFRLAIPEIDFQLRDARPRLIIIEDKFRATLEQCVSLKQIEFVWSVPELQDVCSSKKSAAQDFSPHHSLHEDDPVFILYTSGSTGVPKGVLYTHKMLFWNSINTTMRLDITSDDRSVSCMPLFHTGGWNVVPTPFLHRGASICLLKSFNAETVLRLLQDERATMFVAVPTMLQMMAQAKSFAEVDLAALRYFVIGGEPMPLPLIEQWHHKGVPIRQGYGLTEVGPSVTSLHQDDAITKMGSIGKPNFYIDTQIVNEAGQAQSSGGVGELLLKGPTVTPGYWQNQELTAAAIVDGWFHTGDLVKQDQEGYLFVVDRKKNMYISGGENVYPAEVEKFLHSLPAIEEVAIIGIPDEKWGEVGKAFVVTKPGFTLTEKEVSDYCLGNLAKYKIPKSVQFLSALPKNDAAKINRKELLQIHYSTLNNNH
ncbi:o-succinylbenzoate--CoA ligase [candidate division CSSED10-310 bacterium]|uniref:O-succinylbenzoate--CoA ligase n=1 Tax=candidate division CSSED10-310 bacterium TaxID=2855610 RepID=A0ABV6Z1J9_UNCC1